MQGHGGIVAGTSQGARPERRPRPRHAFFWFTTTGWMMWNFLVVGLLVGTTDRALRRQPRPTRTSPPSGGWPRPAGQLLRHVGPVHPVLPQGRPAAARRVRPLRVDHARLHRRATDARKASAGSRTPSVNTCRSAASPAAPTCAPRSSAPPRTCRSGSVNSPAARSAPPSRPTTSPGEPLDRRGRRTGHHQADAVHAGVVLERPGRQPLQRGVLRRCTPVSGGTATGSRSPRRGSAIIYGRSATPPSTAAACAWAPPSSTAVVEAFDEVLDSLVIDTSGAGRTDGELLCFLVLAPGTELRCRRSENSRRRCASNCPHGTYPTRSS